MKKITVKMLGWPVFTKHAQRICIYFPLQLYYKHSWNAVHLHKHLCAYLSGKYVFDFSIIIFLRFFFNNSNNDNKKKCPDAVC